MEQGTIIYYYPVKEREGQEAAAKKHWWQEAKLTSYRLPERNVSKQTAQKQQGRGDSGYDLHIDACPVPVFYYKKRDWKPQALCGAMETVLYRTEGMTDTCLASGIEKLLPEEMRRKWRPRMETIKQLTALQLEQKAENQNGYVQKAVVRLGNMQDAYWQMEMTWELLNPYLPKINQCVIWYEPTPGVDIREELCDFLDDYYYEYGLVVQTEKYGTGNKASTVSCEQTGTCDLCLDFRRDNLYRSILKYLDTMVKNRYY